MWWALEKEKKILSAPAFSFYNRYSYFSALSNAYSTVHNNNLYYLHQKKKKKIGKNLQRQSDMKPRKTTQKCLNKRLGCKCAINWGDEEVREFKR
jgi:3-polyprenyl-4-hydroxybenzoate decarboxylase